VPRFWEIESREIPNDFDSHCYTTREAVFMCLAPRLISMDTAIEDILPSLDSQCGGLLSSYEYPGRYKRWAIGLLLHCSNCHTITLSRLRHIMSEASFCFRIWQRLYEQSQLQAVTLEYMCKKTQNNYLQKKIEVSNHLSSHRSRNILNSFYSTKMTTWGCTVRLATTWFCSLSQGQSSSNVP